MIAGISTIDADGQRKRVFLDAVGVVGDTPALDSVLDVKGHKGNAPCHLCNYYKSHPAIIGNEYNGEHGKWFRTAHFII